MKAAAGAQGGKPVVGLTAFSKGSRSSLGRRPHETLHGLYVAMVEACGALAVILPAHQSPDPALFDRFDGFVLTGGGDVDPRRYGRETRPEVYGIDPLRDRFESDLVRYAVDHDRPLLGVCRGLQVMNVALGGTLVQDIASMMEHHREHRDLERWADRIHSVRIASRSKLRPVMGPEGWTNSMHHQAVDDLGDGLRVVARADDGVVEALEHEDCRFVVGVQWHPECLGDVAEGRGVFAAFARGLAARAPLHSKPPIFARTGRPIRPEIPRDPQVAP